MPEIKKETTVDPVKKLGEYKSALADLANAISREKSRASVLMASLKSKRDALVTKAKEEKLKAEQQTVETKPIDAQAEEVKKPVEKVEIKAEVASEKETAKATADTKKVESVKAEEVKEPVNNDSSLFNLYQEI